MVARAGSAREVPHECGTSCIPFHREVYFLTMKSLAVALCFSLTLLPASAKLITKTVDYTDEKGTPLHGFVVYDNANPEKRPGVIVVHDWRGITDYTHKRAEMLAQLGYIAFAADIYGKDLSSQGPPEWMKDISIYKGDRDLYRER